MKKILFAFSVLISACTGNPSSQTEEPVKSTPVINYAVTNSFSHSTSSFTEGLVFHQGKLYESTGSPEDLPQTESVIGILNLENGKIEEKVRLDKKAYFGEGIVFLNDKLFQLTYQNQICFVYDARSFNQIGKYQYKNTEGWGLTTDRNFIIMSDGSHILTYLDPESFQTTKTIPVSENGYAVEHLNELEYIDGFIYANVWMKDVIVKIDPATGQVVGKLDLTNLRKEVLKIYPDALETNGIAYQPDTKKIMVTGKLWPKIYEIELSQ